MIKLPLGSIIMAGMLLLASAVPASAGDGLDVVRDTRGGVVTSANGNCVRTKWMTDNSICGAMGRENHVVYFGFNKSSLSADAKASLDALAAQMQGSEKVTGAKIYGYADRIGNPAYNEALSMKRAKAVQSYLSKKGVVNSRVTQTRWFGENVPATNCSDALSHAALVACLAPDRRVEIEFEYAM